jgi:uncharacterized membrane protein
MNEEGILLLSTVMEILAVFSIGLALIVLWINWRAKKAERPKDSSTARSRLSDVVDERRRE